MFTQELYPPLWHCLYLHLRLALLESVLLTDSCETLSCLQIVLYANADNCSIAILYLELSIVQGDCPIFATSPARLLLTTQQDLKVVSWVYGHLNMTRLWFSLYANLYQVQMHGHIYLFAWVCLCTSVHMCVFPCVDTEHSDGNGNVCLSWIFHPSHWL